MWGVIFGCLLANSEDMYLKAYPFAENPSEHTIFIKQLDNAFLFNHKARTGIVDWAFLSTKRWSVPMPTFERSPRPAS
jgi:hypothetical protein